jgi:hypothetical protein
MKKINKTDAEIGAAFREFLSKTDFSLLHDQKGDLVARVEGELCRHNETDDLDGIINFLDAFQDICADKLGIWEFPKTADFG